jgi:two-component system, chemotaxis family, protein-glutamate methylesterase/glutaminase
MTRTDLVIIGASWGGLAAVGEVLSGLPRDFPAPVLVVQHRGEEHRGDLLEGLLDRAGPLAVQEVEDKSRLRPGYVHLAPPGYHVLVEHGHLALSTEDRVRNSRPSIDVALETGADVYGPGLIGVVLTGANDDGAAGLAAVRRHGGIGIVQNPETSEARAMPAAALAAARPQVVTDLAEIASLLVRLAGSASGSAAGGRA